MITYNMLLKINMEFISQNNNNNLRNNLQSIKKKKKINNNMLQKVKNQINLSMLILFT